MPLTLSQTLSLEAQGNPHYALTLLGSSPTTILEELGIISLFQIKIGTLNEVAKVTHTCSEGARYQSLLSGRPPWPCSTGTPLTPS